jgi:hypothetical protein
VTSAGVVAVDLKAAIVHEDYETAFGRDAETGGIGSWTGFLKSGGTAGQLAQELTMSPEFRALHSQQTDTQYVESLYENGLGRTADSLGLQSWASALQSGSMTRADVLANIAQSPESQHHWGFAEQGTSFTNSDTPRRMRFSSDCYEKRMRQLAKANAAVIAEIYAAYADSGANYDVLHIHGVLVTKGIRVSRRRVKRLMSLAALKDQTRAN